MDFAAFARTPPKFHFWDGDWKDGGFSTYHLEKIYDFCRKHGPVSPTVLETGAGNSTVCFLHLEPARLISIALEQPLFDRVTEYCRVNAISTDPLQIHVGGSEWALPALASNQDHPRLDFALIDGCHGYPMVAIDFFYINTMLRKGGFLLIDDIRLHSVAELFRLLSCQTEDFRLAANLGKLQIFEKLTDASQLGWWGTQRYVAALSGFPARPLLNGFISSVLAIRNMKQNLLRWK